MSSIVQNSSQSSGYPIISNSYTLLSEKFINIVISIFKFSSIMNFNSEKNHQAVADLRGVRGMRAPWGRKSFNFVQFLGKFSKIVCWRPPWGVGAPSSGKSWIRHCQGTWPIWVTLSPLYARQWRVYIVKFWMRALPLGPIFFIFIQFMAKFGPIIGWTPPPRLGNPGSAATG